MSDDHRHVWGPLRPSSLGGLIVRHCAVTGCSVANVYDDPEDFCHQCGGHFDIADDGTAFHLSADSADQIDHDADADHVPYSLEWEGVP